MQRYRTLWISDVHLGTKDCKAAQLNAFLKGHRAEKIYLVGDIIDGWKMKSGIYWKQDFTRVIRQLLTLSKKGVQIDYITGNHDEFLRRFANNRFDNIHIYNRVTHTTADGRKLLIIHGDQFDSLTRAHEALKFLGDKGNDLLMLLNRALNSLRNKYGHGYWSLAGFLKQRIPQAQRYINTYEEGVAYAAKKQGYDGVVCGHIHHAAAKRIGDIDYYNTGDWVESCTALAEDFDGKIHLLRWPTDKSAQKKLNATEEKADLIPELEDGALAMTELEDLLDFETTRDIEESLTADGSEYVDDIQHRDDSRSDVTAKKVDDFQDLDRVPALIIPIAL